MDSPNVKMRRHKSLPTTSRCSTILMRLSQSNNPYVGTFRHSPPTSSVYSEWKLAARERTRMWMNLYDCKNSPYVGTKRHAAWRLVHAPSSTILESALRRLLIEQAMLPKKINGIHRLKDLLCGHLRGGGTNECIVDWHLAKQSPTTSGTVQVLTRLACWLLTPFQETIIIGASDGDNVDAEASSVLTHDFSEKDDFAAQDSFDDGDDYNDNCSYMDNDSGDFGSNSVISSQAEAYYAHQATSKGWEHHQQQPQDHRLDYTITQMDILRMMRNASRHLDVESIVRLPVYIYQKDIKTQPDGEGSWFMVEQHHQDEGATATEEGEQDFCVICLEHFSNGDRLRVLPCDHFFHDGCISKWLSGSHSFEDCFTSGCPTCRKRPDDQHLLLCPEATVEESALSDGNVPSWAFTRIGDALARNF